MSENEVISTKNKILSAARYEISEYGFEGARVDKIAVRAGTNKRMLYHYFRNKDGIHQAVVETIYQELRAHEASLELDKQPPIDAIKMLVEHTFKYFKSNTDSVRILNDENQHNARHVCQSKNIIGLRPKLLNTISEVLDRGVKAGLFRNDINPALFYIMVASICYFHVSNEKTLNAFLGISTITSPHSEELLELGKRAALGSLLLR